MDNFHLLNLPNSQASILKGDRVMVSVYREIYSDCIIVRLDNFAFINTNNKILDILF